MSGETAPSNEVGSCVTARSSNSSLGLDRNQIPSRSYSLLSGYIADMDSSEEDNGFFNGGLVEISEYAVHNANDSDDLPGQQELDSSVVPEVIGDTDDFSRARGSSSVLDGDNSSSAIVCVRFVEPTEEQGPANVMRKKSEAGVATKNE